MTVRILSLLTLSALALAPAAAASDPEPPTPWQAQARRVVVAPLNLMVNTPEDLSGKEGPVWDALVQHFQESGQQVAVIEPASAKALWIAATNDLDLSDRAAALRRARSRFARLLAEHRGYDALVVPSLVLRAAAVHGQHASWDGVRRRALEDRDMIAPGIADRAHPFGTAWSVATSGLYGEIAAASLHLAILDANGRLVSEGLGGLALARRPQHDARSHAWTSEPLARPFDDPDHLREGIELAAAGLAADDAPSPLAALRR